MPESPDRRKVTMTSVSLAPNGQTIRHEATDYVAVEHLDAYVTDARTRWQIVSVSDETDHGPEGIIGEYVEPTHLSQES